ncbi:MAG: hypothetical protein ACYS80_10735 [Planctomycetota bacterium]|jgi:hypothetical protein
MSGLRKYIQPAKEIWVDKSARTPSLGDTLEGAATGSTVRVFPGSYSDTGVTIGNAINVLFEPGVTWSGTDTLFTLGVGSVVIQGMNNFNVTLACTHAENPVFVPNGKSYSLEGVQLENTGSNGLTMAETGVTAHVRDLRILSYGAGGVIVSGGTLFSWGRLQIGEKVGITPSDDIYGLNVTGGTAHFTGQTNIYAEKINDSGDEAVNVNGGDCVMYAGAILALKGGAQNFRAVHVQSGNFSLYNGSEMANNCQTLPTIEYENGTGGVIHHSYMKNNDTNGGATSQAFVCGTGTPEVSGCFFVAKTAHTAGSATITDCSDILT